jgi:hypothetical protein
MNTSRYKLSITYAPRKKRLDALDLARVNTPRPCPRVRWDSVDRREGF